MVGDTTANLLIFIYLVFPLSSHVDLGCAYDNKITTINNRVLNSLGQFSIWHEREETMVTLLQERLSVLRNQATMLQRYVAHVRRNLARQEHGMETYPNSIKRENFHFASLRHMLIINALLAKCSNSKANVIESLDIPYAEIVELVSFHDLFYSTIAWINYGQVYLDKPENLSRGLDFDSKFGAHLTELQSAEIGMFSLLMRRHSISIDWLEQAIQNHLTNQIVQHVALDLIISMYLLSVQQHNRKWVGTSALKIAVSNNHESLKEILSLYTFPVEARRDFSWRLISNEKIAQMQVALNLTERGKASKSTTDEIHLSYLCRGNTYLSNAQQAKLKCFYEHRRHPYLYINPVKVEQLAEEPPLFQFYEMLTNSIIDMLKQLHSPQVETLVAQGPWETDLGSHCDFKATTGYDADTPAKFYRNSEIVTGLKFRGSGWHGLYVEYTYGLMYQFHFDRSGTESEVKKQILKREGDFVASILHYLEVPQMGGQTPFVYSGVVVRPVRGSAIFWYNMYRNGTRRRDTLHASCPVRHGEKIITANFFRYNNNWDCHKCTLNQSE